MMNIRIDSVELVPNPVNTKAQLLIAVTIPEILAGLLTADGCYIETVDAACLVTEGG